MLHPPGFYYVKKLKRFVILPSDKSSERNLSCFFDIIKPRRMEHLQSEEPFSSDPYFSEIFGFFKEMTSEILVLYLDESYLNTDQEPRRARKVGYSAMANDSL